MVNDSELQGYGSFNPRRIVDYGSVREEDQTQAAASPLIIDPQPPPLYVSSIIRQWILPGSCVLLMAVAGYCYYGVSPLTGYATSNTVGSSSQDNNYFQELLEKDTIFLEGAHHDAGHGKIHTLLLDPKYDEAELFYKDQLIDHMNSSNKKTYSQRYYKKSKYWKGPGYPILVLVGGEASLEPPLLFPFVNERLAQEFGAFVVSPELRFYGKSQPVGRHPSIQQVVAYLTPDQALADSIALITMLRQKLGCSMDRTSHQYCPVLIFGGSYPGFLSSMMRFRFPDIVDISYASSAPLKVYSQEADPNAYFDKITQVAEEASPGCAHAVRSTMEAVREELLLFASDTSVSKAAQKVGFCPKSVPHYIQDISTLISETIIYLIPAVFADFNMAYYPPGPTTAFERACAIFQDDSSSPTQRIANFFALRGEAEYLLGGDDNNQKPPTCFDLTLELPSGPHARIRGSDNSGTGGGLAGEMWDFQCCQDLVVGAGYSEQSMFIPRPFDYDWHRHHCHQRFPGITVDPFRMVHQWGFDDLSQTSHILFTNGLHDGWSADSILTTDNPKLAVLNFPNGAHRSDLAQKGQAHHSENGSLEEDTPDIVAGQNEATEILKKWLDDIKAQRVSS